MHVRLHDKAHHYVQETDIVDEEDSYEKKFPPKGFVVAD